MASRIVTYLPRLLQLLRAVCMYTGRNRASIIKFIGNNQPLLNAFTAWEAACEALIVPLDAVVNPRP